MHGRHVLDHHPDEHRPGVPAARDEAAEHAGPRRLLVEMEGLRVELPGVLDDLFPGDFIAPEAHDVADLHVLEVLHAAPAGRRSYIVIPTTATTTSPC